jgi:hypothetical protein
MLSFVCDLDVGSKLYFQYLEERFESKTVRLFGAVIFLVRTVSTIDMTTNCSRY